MCSKAAPAHALRPALAPKQKRGAVAGAREGRSLGSKRVHLAPAGRAPAGAARPPAAAGGLASQQGRRCRGGRAGGGAAAGGRDLTMGPRRGRYKSWAEAGRARQPWPPSGGRAAAAAPAAPAPRRRAHDAAGAPPAGRMKRRPSAAPLPPKPDPDSTAFRRAGVLVAHGTGAALDPLGGRQRPLSVSQMGRLLGQQCCLSSQHVALGMGQQPHVKQNPLISLRRAGGGAREEGLKGRWRSSVRRRQTGAAPANGRRQRRPFPSATNADPSLRT